ncbi:hypothetical protein OIV83_000719 [Microbotryomycetes sp. JL201]|nr:hypothetical protein OIV83_000719 [Microbotryomycetes sp. JL201]
MLPRATTRTTRTDYAARGRHFISSSRPRRIATRPSEHTPTSTTPTTDRPPLLTRETIYPFIMLSIITSLALNLRHSRSQREADERRLEAQVDVLQDTIAHLKLQNWSTLPSQDREQIEKRLERVGLGRAKGKARDDNQRPLSDMMATSWFEVLFGKKGKQFEQKEDDTDWDLVMKEADEAETKRQQGIVDDRPALDGASRTPSIAANPRHMPLPTQSKPRPIQPASSETGVYL